MVHMWSRLTSIPSCDDPWGTPQNKDEGGRTMSNFEKVVIWTGIGIAVLHAVSAVLQAVSATALGWNQLHPKPTQ